MGTAQDPRPVKLVISMLTGHPELWDAALPRLEDEFGPTELVTDPWAFDHTGYYEPEFGPDLMRRFATFSQLIQPERLPAIKNLTNDLESQWTAEGKRLINLDPGYVSLSKLVLATTKNHAHRLYLGQGIYGEVTLFYHKGSFCAWPWTYPDYASEPYLALFDRIRAAYVIEMRQPG